MGQHFSPAAHFTDVYGLLLKEEEMLRDCEHDPFPTFSSRVAAIKLKITFFLKWYVFSV